MQWLPNMYLKISQFYILRFSESARDTRKPARRHCNTVKIMAALTECLSKPVEDIRCRKIGEPISTRISPHGSLQQGERTHTLVKLVRLELMKG